MSTARLDPTAIDSARSQVPTQVNIPWWYGVSLVLGLWLFARPYVGVRHDGMLYLGQALRHLHPQVFGGDLFFAFGSQDQFSFAARLLAHSYSLVGIADSQWIFLGSAHAAFMVAVALLVKSLPTARARWLSLASVAAISHSYGGAGLLAFTEQFVTARTLAEPVALFALVCLLNRRLVLAALLALVATALHPLMAFPVIVTGWLMLCRQDRRWWSAAAVMLIPVALGLAQIAPFTGLFQQFDTTWFQAVEHSNTLVLPHLWTAADWELIGLDFALVLGTLRLLSPNLRRMAESAVMAACGLLAVSLLGADVLHNVLITGLQLWRSIWLTHLLALICLPVLLLSLWSEGQIGRLAALACAIAVTGINARWPAGWAFCAWLAIVAALRAWPQSVSPRLMKGAFTLSGLALAMLSIAIAVQNVRDLLAAGAMLTPLMMLWIAFTLPTVSMPLAALSLEYFRREGTARLALTCLLPAIAVFALTHWDRREPWARYIEETPFGTHPFSAKMPPNAEVYWPGQLPMVWSAVGRRNWYSLAQGGGVLFNRETAREFTRRREAVAVYQMQHELCSVIAAVTDSGSHAEDCAPEPKVFEDLCSFPRGPDFLVLPFRFPRGVIDEWSFGLPANSQTQYLYDCAKLR